MQLGRGYVNPNPCTDADLSENWQRLFQFQTVVNQFIAGGGVDSYTVKAHSTDANPNTLDQKIVDSNTFDSGSHQVVMWQVVGNQLKLFTDKGVGAGDNFTVKVASGGTAGFLDTKIHAGSWEPADTYAAGTHHFVLAANVDDAVRFYSPYAIIKTSSGDSSPGYLADKFGDTGTYNPSNDALVKFQNLGSTLRGFVTKAAIQAVIDTLSVGNTRLVALVDSVLGATKSGSAITPTTVTAKVVGWNAGTGKFDITNTDITCLWTRPEDILLSTGRILIAEAVPLADDPTKLILRPPSCDSFPE